MCNNNLEDYTRVEKRKAAGKYFPEKRLQREHMLGVCVCVCMGKICTQRCDEYEQKEEKKK